MLLLVFVLKKHRLCVVLVTHGKPLFHSVHPFAHTHTFTHKDTHSHTLTSLYVSKPNS